MGLSPITVYLAITLAIGSSVIETEGVESEGIESEGPFVTTGKGTLKGRFETSRNGIKYEAYLGIPYASVSQRFEVSVPTGSWKGLKDATEFGPHCAQQTLMGPPVTGTEDCLTLNVFTPKSDEKKRGVLVYIHGGGWNLGSSAEYGGDYLVDEDIVLVTINYRLGILGFLDSSDGLVTGNMGLKDQVLALKWVQENIDQFGGDKNQVTIGGNSAGGGGATHLMISPMSQGLFHGILSFSGTFMSVWGITEKNIQYLKEIGESLKCDVERMEELIECLRKEPLDSLIRAQKSLSAWDLDYFKIFPSVEVKTNNPEPFLDEFPEERLRKGNFAKVPVMLTLTQDEGLLLYAALIVRNETLLKDLNENFERIGPITFMYENDRRLSSRKDLVSEEIRNFYFDGKDITPGDEKILSDVYKDTYFMRGSHKFSQILGKQTVVYPGLFTHSRKDYSPVQLFGIQDEMKGVSHCEELSYLFSETGHPHPFPVIVSLKEDKDIQFSKKFVKIIATFVKTGKPPPEQGAKWMPVSKEEIESDALNWFNLGEEDFVHVNPFEKRLQFWKDLERERKDEL